MSKNIVHSKYGITIIITDSTITFRPIIKISLLSSANLEVPSEI